MLAELRGTGRAGAGVGDLPGGLGLDRLDLGGRGFRVGGPVKLGGQLSQAAGQGGDVSADTRAQLGSPRRGHGDRAVQVGRLSRGASLTAEFLATPERGQRGVQLAGHRIRLTAVLRLRPGAVLGRARLPVT